METALNEIEISSVSLMSGIECTARVVPSVEQGIRFHYKGQTVQACLENVVSTEHCTVIGNKDVQIVLIEHFMAACAICNVTAIDVFLTHYEMPILDGSSKEWIELFGKLGYKPMSPEEIVNNNQKMKFEPAVYLNGKTHLAVVPSEDFRVSYSVNYRHPELSNRWVELTPENLNEIIEARTFGYLKELEMMQAAGYGRGATIDNTVGMTDDGYTTELRSAYEPAKHKILDLIGDFYLTGINPLTLGAQFIAKEAGHTVHVKTAKILKEYINRT